VTEYLVENIDVEIEDVHIEFYKACDVGGSKVDEEGGTLVSVVEMSNEIVLMTAVSIIITGTDNFHPTFLSDKARELGLCHISPFSWIPSIIRPGSPI
jgi:hypothetical protein